MDTHRTGRDQLRPGRQDPVQVLNRPVCYPRTRVEDLAAEGRWPRWAPLAAGLGIGALLAVQLYTDTTLGALNLYFEQP